MGENERLLTAGGIATIVTAIGFVLGLVTKYMLEKRKLDDDSGGKLIDKIHARIVELERENKVCMERNVEMAKQVGFLQARCETLELWMKENNARDIAVEAVKNMNVEHLTVEELTDESKKTR